MADFNVGRADGSSSTVRVLDCGDAGHVNVPPAVKYEQATADELIKTGAGVFYGVIVTTALSAAVVEIRDATSAGGGTVIATLPASSAIGTKIDFGGMGVRFNTGLYAAFAGTGTITVLYV